MITKLVRTAVTVLLAVLLGAAVTAAPAAARTPTPASVAVVEAGGETGATLAAEWQAWGHYFGVEACRNQGRHLLEMRLITTYRCVLVGLLIHRLDIKPVPIL